MKKTILVSIYMFSFIVATLLGYWVAENKAKIAKVEPVSKIIPRPLEKYSFDNLMQRGGIASEIKIENTISKEDSFTSYLVSFTTEGKKVTGQMNIPAGLGPFPAILMFRGYADAQKYKTGTGTAPSAKVYARKGFITFAPDFLGYAGSDDHTNEQITARLENYTTALDALASLEGYKTVGKGDIFIWGHSNGGHLAIATLEMSQKDYPATLWAPVTASFPHSALFFQDELFDKGKQLRKAISEFEKLYDVYKFSPDNYIDWLNAPLQIHHGTADTEVPKQWSDDFVKNLKDKEKNIVYFVYPGTNHNMQPTWNAIVERDITFFKKYLE